LARTRNVANAITRVIAGKRRKKSSGDAVGDTCVWAKKQRAIRRSAPFVAALGPASTPRADYSFHHGAGGEVAST
jgi:hypothetical protein